MISNNADYGYSWPIIDGRNVAHGIKASAGEVFSEEELLERWRITKQQFQAFVKMGLTPITLPDGSVLYLKAQIDYFFSKIANQKENQSATVTGQLASADTIPRHSESKESPYLDANGAADYLGISMKSLYGIVERKHLIPLRGPRRRYKFTKEMLDNYLRRPESK